MIQSFADRATEDFYRYGICPAQWRMFASVANRKLDMLNAATSLRDVRSPPGNRLESLASDRLGQHVAHLLPLG